MTNEEQMDAYGITAEERVVYLYKNYKYDKLSEAIKYAKIDALVMEKTKKPENSFL